MVAGRSCRKAVGERGKREGRREGEDKDRGWWQEKREEGNDGGGGRNYERKTRMEAVREKTGGGRHGWREEGEKKIGGRKE